MASSATAPPKLSARQRWIVAGALSLQVITGVIFYPVAAVLILTGILAPLSFVIARIGTMPLSWLSKRRSAWRAQNLTLDISPVSRARS